MPTYTRPELALRNGQDRPEIWIAWEGKIFDVTESRL
ncbi:MAG: cytochrome b5, partial [Sphingomonadales bacterium]|nr:cytochrome b5 [Sphingomonadales bacterium]